MIFDNRIDVGIGFESAVPSGAMAGRTAIVRDETPTRDSDGRNVVRESFVELSSESLILAQDERWRRA
jgi:hypothetical protein